MPKRSTTITGDAKTYKVLQPAGGVALETFIPFKLIKRGVRREVITPFDAPEQFRREATEEKASNHESTLVRSLGLAFHWRRLLKMGKVKSISEIAEREGIDKAHVSRLLRLTYIAPDIVKRILNGSAPQRLSLGYFKRNPLPNLWEEQRILLEAHKPQVGTR